MIIGLEMNAKIYLKGGGDPSLLRLKLQNCIDQAKVKVEYVIAEGFDEFEIDKPGYRPTENSTSFASTTRTKF